MMTKAKRNDRNEHSKPVNSEDAAVKAASPAASVSVASDKESGGEPCRERTSDDFDMAVRELAYSKWEAAGFPEGDGFDFWLEAEREIKARQ